MAAALVVAAGLGRVRPLSKWFSASCWGISSWGSKTSAAAARDISLGNVFGGLGDCLGGRVSFKQLHLYTTQGLTT